jgi:hypothetical protein
MKLILPIAWFPSVEYFICILKADEVFIEKHEYYIKQTYRNRMNIYSPNGLLSLSVPVIKVNGNKTLINDICISYTSGWQTIHWRSIETAYNSSPFFLYYKDEISPFFNQHFDKLFEYDLYILQKLMELIGIKKEIKFTEKFIMDTDKACLVSTNDLINLRNNFTPKKSIQHSAFNIQHFEYIQVYNKKYGFLPNLSILDLLFNLGPSTSKYLKSQISTEII